MANPGRNDYKFTPIVDAVTLLNQKVNLLGVVTEVGIPKRTNGTGLLMNQTQALGSPLIFLLKLLKSSQMFESPGDIIQLSHVMIKSYETEVNAVFYKDSGTFALYKGSDGSTFRHYQASSILFTRVPNKLIADLRKLAIDHQTLLKDPLGSVQLREIKHGLQFHLICKILRICETAQGQWMIFVWDGTDAPPVNVHAKLEEELEKPVPLQLEENPLSIDVLRTFPTVGTILRITTEKCNERLTLKFLKVGIWVQFKNVLFEARDGLWCGFLVRSPKFSYLSDDNKLVLQYERLYKKRYKGKWTRMPYTCVPRPSPITVTDREDVPFVTLMDILTYPEVIGKYRCVVRVLATLPGAATEFRAPNGIFRLRLTLEDPTARIHAYLYDKDAEKFFGGYPADDETIKLHSALLGIDQTNGNARNPPWVSVLLKSYNIDELDIWGSRRYGFLDTKLVV